MSVGKHMFSDKPHPVLALRHLAKKTPTSAYNPYTKSFGRNATVGHP